MGKPLYTDADVERQVAVATKEKDFRDPFRRDLARLVHCPSFRRLQGKTQLFPAYENDFYRNRLTHSIEVAQIATGIALTLNGSEKALQDQPINEHLVHFAALAHDLGHPPFGHNGETVLDEKVIDQGGFEGNAQTLRILARLEKKETRAFPLKGGVANPIVDKQDDRLGLNLTYRSLASVMKYDRRIPETNEEVKNQKIPKRPVKGYYHSEEKLVSDIKAHVAPGFTGQFKTLECGIMDLADDIAYSTYDVEDAFKAGFLSPLGMAAASADEKAAIVSEINEKLAEEYGTNAHNSLLTIEEVDHVLKNSIFHQLFVGDGDVDKYAGASQIFRQSKVLGEDGYFRTEFTSKLVHLFMTGVEYQHNDDFPVMSRVRFNIPTFKMVEILKKYAFKSLILSPRIKIAESRGREIISTIFGSLIEAEDGRRLLPEDWRRVYFGLDGEPWRRRTVCDFIACMTDRYCVEFYSRLVGQDAPSIHKPF